MTQSPHITISTLRLHNFRGIEEVSIPFHPSLNVLIGKNGAGKTAVLDAMASLLQFLSQKIKSEDIRLEGFSENDIKNGTIEAVNEIDISFSLTNEEETESIDLSWYASLTREGYEPDNISDQTDFNRLDQWVRQLNEALREDRPASIPVLAYYPCSASPALKPSFSNGSPKVDIFSTYDQSLSYHSFDFEAFFDWFKWQDNISRQTQNSFLLDTVKKAIYGILSDRLQSFSDLHINWLDSPKGELLIKKNGATLKVQQFSSGEKSIFTLTADLARRLALANPKSSTPLSGNGVVLIDEIDLHLHPSWQQLVVPKLRSTFPNIQFIITTHSPEVLQNVDRECIIILENGQVRDHELNPYTKGRQLDEISQDVFGLSVYPEHTEELQALQDKIRRCYDLIDEENYQEAYPLYKEILAVKGPEDSEVQRIQHLLNLISPGPDEIHSKRKPTGLS